jgi:hypothetical protein
MGRIDEPLHQIDAQNPPADPGGGIAAVLNVAGVLATLLPGGAAFSAAAQLAAFAKQFHDNARETARAEAFVRGLVEQLSDEGRRIDTLERRVRGPEAEEAVVVAIQRTSNAARLDKARQYGRIIGGTANQSEPDWQEAAQFIRDLEQFTDRDVLALKILWRLQRTSYKVKEGDRRMMSTGADNYSKGWKEVLERARTSGFVQDDWYSECARLSGFGLALQVQANPSYQGPDSVCYRLTGRAVRLLNLLGMNTDSGAYPSVRYHPTLGTKTVNDEDEDAALGPDWVDTPAKFRTT